MYRKYYVVAFIFLGLGILGCDGQVERNIGRLDSAKVRLEANPNDEEALSTILGLLKDRNGINRSNAAAVLGQAAEKVGGQIKDRALPPLIDLLDSGDLFDKRAAAIGIMGFGANATGAVPVLRKNLFPSSADFAEISAEALGKIGEPAAVAVPDLLKVIDENLVDDPNYERTIRATATRVIGQIGPKAVAAAPRLLTLLDQSNNPAFKIQLAVAVIRIDPANIKALSEIDKLMGSPDVDQRILMISELVDAGRDARPALSVIKAAQNDADSDVRSMAKRLLAMLDT